MKLTSVLLTFLVLALILAACIASGGTLVTSSEPGIDNSAASQKARADYAMEQAKQQEEAAFAAAVNETAQAKAGENVLALAATATAQALAVARAQLELTANAANISSTQAAMSAEQTAIAIEANATIDAQTILLAQQQAQATATAQALQLESLTAKQLATASQQQRVLLSWFIPVTAAIAFGFIMLLGAKFISGMIDATNERRSLENQRLTLLSTLFDAPTETIIFADDPHTGLPRSRLFFTPEPGSVNSSDESDSSFEPIIGDDGQSSIFIVSNGDKFVADSAEAREEAARCKLAMKLLRDAINQVGAQSNRIPSAGQLGWPVGVWTIAVAILRPYGVERLRGADGGTYLTGQYPNLQTLYIAIGERRLSFFPTTSKVVIDG
jgi:hypothetical protein